MRLASYAPFSLMLITALGCAAACSGDDDDDSANTAGKSSTGGKNATAGSNSQAGSDSKGGEAAGGTGPVDSKLCTDLGGPAGIDGVVRGDSKTSKTDPFNGFKFGASDDRKASVLLNVATDPCIGQQFAHLLAAEKAAELEHLAECLSLFVQNTAGCAVAYDGAKDKAGKVCKSMKSAHVGLGVSEADYTALIGDAAKALIDAGVDPTSAQFKAVAGALTGDDLKADIITNDDPALSQPGGECAPGAGGAGGAAAGGAGGAGGAP